MVRGMRVQEVKAFRALLAGWLLVFGSVTMAASRYVTVRLAHGVSFPLPSNWQVFSNNTRITLDAWVHANIPESPGNLTFAANLYDDRGTTLGISNVRFYPDQSVTQEDVRAASKQDLVELDASLKHSLTEGVVRSGGRIVEWKGTTRQVINGRQVLISEYRRVALTGQGTFAARMIRVLNGPKSFTLTLSVRGECCARLPTM